MTILREGYTDPLIIDNSFKKTILRLILHSNISIFISTFKAELTPENKNDTLYKLFEVLLLKKKKRVNVKILLNYHEDKRRIAKTNIKVFDFFKSHGIPIRYLPRNRCNHAKLFILDNSLAVIGSHNLSHMSLSSNFEASYIIDNPHHVKRLTKTFLQTFNDAKNY